MGVLVVAKVLCLLFLQHFCSLKPQVHILYPTAWFYFSAGFSIYANTGLPLELKTKHFSFWSNSGMFFYIALVAKIQSTEDCAPSTSGMKS